MNDIGWQIIWIVVSLAAGLFFSLNAVAAKVFSRVKLQEIFKKLKKEDLAEKFFADADKIAAACSLIVIAANICAVLLFVKLFSRLSDSSTTAVVIYAAVLSFLLMGFFEVLISFAWAGYSGEAILAGTYPFLKLVKLLFTPFGPLFRLHDVIVRRLVGTDDSPDAKQEARQEEFLNVVEQGKMEGVVDEVEQEMIEHVLELNETTAEEIMTPRTDMVALKVDSDLQTVLDAIVTKGHSRIPVYEETVDTIIGLVYAKDLLGKAADSFHLKDNLREAYFVPETKTLRRLLREFQEQKLHIAVVLDEYGGTAGIVTIEDIIEEVVGEIADEYEQHPPESLKKIDESTVEVDARMDIDDFNDQFEVEIPDEEDYDTLGGFVFSYLGYIPKAGETFVYNNLKFTVTASEKRKINRVKIRKLLQEE